MSDNIIIDINESPLDRIKNLPLFKQIEAKIREQRTIEATKKNISKKATMVARYLGQPIRGQAGVVDFEETEEIVDATEGTVYLYGWQFDALSHGCNIQVSYIRENHRIAIFLNGYLVYEEISGDIMRYLPNLEWENRIDHWAARAEKIKKRADLVEKENDEAYAKNLLQNIKTLLRMDWGV